MEQYRHVDRSTAETNLRKQATKILHDIANAYDMGTLDDPTGAVMYCGLLACICEGKVEGILDQDTGTVKWSLTKDYASELEQVQANLLEEAVRKGTVVQGPWS